jgi:thiol:disulfide interchange protein
VLAGWFGGARLFSQAWQKIPWQEWSPGIAEELASEGYTVYVDYTATWCLTCQANKRFVLETDDVRSEFSRLNVVPIKGDFTNRDERMQRELQNHGRNGVPLNIVVPAGKPDGAIVLPEVLTKSIVIAALEKAGPSLKEPQLVRKER